MTDPGHKSESQPLSDGNKVKVLSPGVEAIPVATKPKSSVDDLTPEEQMALFEKDLKENDWGHQPC